VILPPATATIAVTATTAATSTPRPTRTPAPPPTTQPTATPPTSPNLAVQPVTWKLHRHKSTSTMCESVASNGSPESPQTIVNHGQHAATWLWTPQGVQGLLWRINDALFTMSGLPNDNSLAAGATDTLDVKVTCPNTTTTYTITLYETDKTTGQL